LKNQNINYAGNLPCLTHPKYRPDIDGLRAVAVLSVVGFHAFPFWVKGGFIGVDIFFVISGYLISTIIFENLENNSFNFIEFYSRRIKRIFPALLTVLIASFIVGWFVLLADEYRQLGKHIAAGSGFVSNLILWGESGYFDNAADTKILLHLWSLGIEEQFYIFWPLLLWTAFKVRLNWLALTFAVVVISFILNIRGINSDAIATFYSPQTRFWELLIGAILAYNVVNRQSILLKIELWVGGIFGAEQVLYKESKFLQNVPSILGVGFIAAGVLLITRESVFPGYWALLPTIGAALIISSSLNAWVNRVILSNRILVWFGLLSYPLYLWHYPVLTFIRVVDGEMPTRSMRIAAVFISIVLAWLTYKFIENPVRLGKHSNSRLLTLLFSMVIVGYAGYYTYKQDGLRFRSAETEYIKNDGDIGNITYKKYFDKRFYPYAGLPGDKRCIQSNKNGEVSIAILGDSHATNLFLAISDSLPKNIVNCSIQLRKSSEAFKTIFDQISKDKNIHSVILSSYWYWWNFRLTKNPNFKQELT
jgi:peptidoglycan/LPS O-acetylase OafA/YrhL